jgi:hypothetical protein
LLCVHLLTFVLDILLLFEIGLLLVVPRIFRRWLGECDSNLFNGRLLPSESFFSVTSAERPFWVVKLAWFGQFWDCRLRILFKIGFNPVILTIRVIVRSSCQPVNNHRDRWFTRRSRALKCDVKQWKGENKYWPVMQRMCSERSTSTIRTIWTINVRQNCETSIKSGNTLWMEWRDVQGGYMGKTGTMEFTVSLRHAVPESGSVEVQVNAVWLECTDSRVDHSPRQFPTTDEIVLLFPRASTGISRVSRYIAPLYVNGIFMRFSHTLMHINCVGNCQVLRFSCFFQGFR